MKSCEDSDVLRDLLEGVIDAAIALAEADFGNIQCLGTDGNLKIIAQRGFPDWWIAHWDAAGAGHGSCGTSLLSGERVIVEDVAHSPLFVGTSDLEIQLRAGVRAVQSTPLRGRSGRILGVFSTHYRKPHQPAPKTLAVLGLLAAHATALIEREEMVRELSLREKQLSAVLDGTSDAVYVKDNKGRYQLINQAGLGVVRKRLEEVIGQSDLGLFPPAEARDIMQRDLKVMNGGKPQTYEESLTFTDAASASRSIRATAAKCRASSARPMPRCSTPRSKAATVWSSSRRTCRRA